MNDSLKFYIFELYYFLFKHKYYDMMNCTHRDRHLSFLHAFKHGDITYERFKEAETLYGDLWYRE